jgi:hypothetical protein
VAGRLWRTDKPLFLPQINNDSSVLLPVTQLLQWLSSYSCCLLPTALILLTNHITFNLFMYLSICTFWQLQKHLCEARKETVKALVNTNGPETGYQVNEDAIIAAVKQVPWSASHYIARELELYQLKHFLMSNWSHTLLQGTYICFETMVLYTDSTCTYKAKTIWYHTCCNSKNIHLRTWT